MADTLPSKRVAVDHGSKRLIWLDVLRLLCAFQIVGFHWLRAGFGVGLIDKHNANSFIWLYRNLTSGFAELPNLVIDVGGMTPRAILNNCVGLLFGFGWEAVNVFILISGLTLAMTYDPNYNLKSWYRRRLRRLLLPFYAVAFSFILFAFAFHAMIQVHSGAGGQLAAKVATMIPDSLQVTILTHLVLFDPRRHHWVTEFFSPAWWFIPTILVGYLAFPLLVRIRQHLGSSTTIAIALGISITSYGLIEYGILLENNWYLILTSELFSFVAGIEVGIRLRNDIYVQQRIRQFLNSHISLCIGALLFAVGNIANWFFATFPISSPLYTIGLTLLLSYVATHIDRLKLVSYVAREFDIYIIYLLHQPFAYPMAMLSGLLLGGAAVTIGGAAYFVAVLIAVFLFSLLTTVTIRCLEHRPGHPPIIGHQ